MKIRGQRYMPIISGIWNDQNEYEHLSIVRHRGDGYISKQKVPVNTPITDENYWLQISSYDAQLEEIKEQLKELQKRLK